MHFDITMRRCGLVAWHWELQIDGDKVAVVRAASGSVDHKRLLWFYDRTEYALDLPINDWGFRSWSIYVAGQHFAEGAFQHSNYGLWTAAGPRSWTVDGATVTERSSHCGADLLSDDGQRLACWKNKGYNLTRVVYKPTLFAGNAYLIASFALAWLDRSEY